MQITYIMQEPQVTILCSLRDGRLYNLGMRNEALDQRVPFATSRTQLRAIDEWRRKQPDLPSRSEAIRRLIDQALGMTVESENAE
jgi:hypothetical protein